jgi:selenocysteine lyase/cysteine desulfurase
MDVDRLRTRYPLLERVAYLNAGTDGPVAADAAAAAREAIDAQEREPRFMEHFEARGSDREALRAEYATVMGASTEDVALTTSTSEGLGKVLGGMDLQPGDEVLTSDSEHPGLIGPLLALKARGVTVRTGPIATLSEHVTDATTVIAVSHVNWLTGELADPALGATGVPLVLDGAQGAGAVPIDLEALGCAAYAAAGQKWLCGADGTGLLYVSPAHRSRIRALAPGYGAFVDSAAGLDSGLHDDARAHDTPALPRESVALSLAGIRLLREAGWDAVHARAVDGAAALADRLAEAGRTVAPRAATTLVSFEDPDPEGTSGRLAQAGVVLRHLPGTPYLRASFGAWNDPSDVDALLEGLA